MSVVLEIRISKRLADMLRAEAEKRGYTLQELVVLALAELVRASREEELARAGYA
jgi:predicted HicB family RNase H-like nuclease